MTDRFTVKAYTPDQSDYEKIRAFTRRAFSADELYAFEVTLCDNEIDRDFEKFSVNALSALQNLFVGKTGIKDHSMKAEDQTARVFDTRLEKIPGKKTADGEDYVALRAKAYMVRTPENESLIRDIDAGIKKEVSVSCSAKSRMCSVCGAEKARNTAAISRAARTAENCVIRFWMMCATHMNSVLWQCLRRETQVWKKHLIWKRTVR